MDKWIKVLIILITAVTLLGACSGNQEQADGIQINEVATPEVAENSTYDEEYYYDDLELPPNEEENETSDESLAETSHFSLPERSGARTQTSGTVPHVQIGVVSIEAINEELSRRAFSLPGVENRPTIVSLPGARGMWLSDDIDLAHPEVIVSGREFAHIHPDGSLHAPLPYERALEVAEKGWGERHPWADEREGWDGFVMLFTPLNIAELDITFQLIVESYNHVTGQSLQASDFE
ncbi:luciferase family protein [Candidatus Leptofilum sp.]|uniref:luciferase domain-containing protein n=1 Tax=Candidatus Leptofilum sp. TaxID=3241576 RepID=UPI003B5CF096